MELPRTKTRIFAAFLGVLGCGTAAHAETSVFGYTSTLLGSTVRSSGIYEITLSGAQSGRGAFTNGGLGAAIEGDVFLSAGTRLTIVPGAHGHTNGSVGDGGGCVYSSGVGPLFAVTRGGGATGDTADGIQGLSGDNQGAAVSGGAGGAGSAGALGGIGSSGYYGGGGAGAAFSSRRGGNGDQSAFAISGRDSGGSFLPIGFPEFVWSSGVNSGNGSVSLSNLSAFPATPEMDSWAIGAGLLALLGFEFVRRIVANRRLGGSL